MKLGQKFRGQWLAKVRGRRVPTKGIGRSLGSCPQAQPMDPRWGWWHGGEGFLIGSGLASPALWGRPWGPKSWSWDPVALALGSVRFPRSVRAPALGLGFFLKFMYKGKSYRWHRRAGAMVLRFGSSHLVAPSCPFFVKKRKLGRMRMIFFGTSECALRSLLTKIRAHRPPNVYHGRGLRLVRQGLLRKHGKVSAYR
jgi:hypothetical protein